MRRSTRHIIYVRYLILLLLTPLTAAAQTYNSFQQQKLANALQAENQNGIWGRDSAGHTKNRVVPWGQFMWTIDERLGEVIPAENTDTVVTNFQNWRFTDGMTGDYSFLGNTGSPRLNRIFFDRRTLTDFEPLAPYDFFLGGLFDFRFTNTKSPMTNLAYHSCGNKQTGEDRVRAYFASNINKIAGIGFKIDYDYGRGYYVQSQNSSFGGCLYGYYRGDKYQAHAYFQADRIKHAVNGGIENDDYIENPQSFPQSYSSDDIPVNLASNYYSNYDQRYYLSHRYNTGFYRRIEMPDSIKPKMPADSLLLVQLGDSVRQVVMADTLRLSVTLDSLKRAWEEGIEYEQEFIPVMSFIHTFDVQNMSHDYYSNTSSTMDYYTHNYYGHPAYHDDRQLMRSFRNTLGVSMREGFNKWAKFGITLFATHELLIQKQKYVVAPLDTSYTGRTRNKFSVGGQISKRQGDLFHYGAEGEVWLAGYAVGDFKVDADLDFNIPIGRRDTMQFKATALVEHRKPNLWMEETHTQFAWWDNDLSKQFRTQLMAELANQRTRTKIRFGWCNLTNYAYYAMQNTLYPGKQQGSTIPGDYKHDVVVKQNSGSVQVFMLQLCQDLVVGPLHWENEITWQKTTDEEVLPLPQLNCYSNLYLLFRIAKVLRVQLGGDIRFFTKYYAPDYATAIGQFAVQDYDNGPIKIGAYPIVNAYVNLHLKRCRIYVDAAHVNAGHGRMYLAPHYPINPMTINFGLSWNFFD